MSKKNRTDKILECIDVGLQAAGDIDYGGAGAGLDLCVRCDSRRANDSGWCDLCEPTRAGAPSPETLAPWSVPQPSFRSTLEPGAYTSVYGGIVGYVSSECGCPACESVLRDQPWWDGAAEDEVTGIDQAALDRLNALPSMEIRSISADDANALAWGLLAERVQEEAYQALGWTTLSVDVDRGNDD